MHVYNNSSLSALFVARRYSLALHSNFDPSAYASDFARGRALESSLGDPEFENASVFWCVHAKRGSWWKLGIRIATFHSAMLCFVKKAQKRLNTLSEYFSENFDGEGNIWI